MLRASTMQNGYTHKSNQGGKRSYDSSGNHFLERCPRTPLIHRLGEYVGAPVGVIGAGPVIDKRALRPARP